MINVAPRKATEAKSEETADRTHAYAKIMQRLEEGIQSGRVPNGVVLLEGSLAEIFGSSRSPVKQALRLLESRGLVRRFEGRGFLAGNGAPTRRMKFSASMLQQRAVLPKSFAWQAFYYDFEREISLLSIVGAFRVNELALARHFNVGRTVARDLLLQAQRSGMVTKSGKSHWLIVPLDETRYRDLYELRYLLEPTAIERAAGIIPAATLDAIMARHREARARFPAISISDMDTLENDLHVACVSFGGNPEIDEALKRTRCLLVTSKHLQKSLNRTPQIDPFMDEHLAILKAMKAGHASGAARAMRRHLLSSGDKTLERLAAFRALQSELPRPEYTIPV